MLVSEYLQYLKMFEIHSLKAHLETFNYIYHKTTLNLKRELMEGGEYYCV